ncbi:hypothetical protein ACFC0S_16115 [Streptomyces sp. NPDC056084]|uniref:hypothetical protein n=1 Tax=unclassified Streptomyces TaxID=2593676 RepID=UPI0035D730C9
MNDTTALINEQPDEQDDEETPPTVEDTLETLAQMYLRTVALPLPRNPATFGWQATAGTLAALSARLLHFVNTTDPGRAAGFARFYHGHLGDGPHPLAVTRWLEDAVAGAADFNEWVDQAKEQAEGAFTATSLPNGLADLGVLLGDDVLAVLINGLDASWKQWSEHGSQRRGCFLPGCLRDFDLVGAWAGKDGAHSEGWLSSSAVGYACPEHATYLWAGDHQHIPQWRKDDGLACSCGWSSGPVGFRAHGTVLYQAHALRVLEADA